MQGRATISDAKPQATVPATASGRDYYRLVRALEHAQGFTVLLAVCDSEDLRRELTDRYTRVLSQRDMHVTQVDLAGADDLLARLVAKCPVQPAVLSAYGLERPQEGSDRVRRLLSSMNLQRERYRDELRCPVVFWLYSDTFADMVRYAPDFYDWHSGLYFFEPEAFDHSVASEVSHQLSFSDGAPALPLQQARKRLLDLQDLFADLEAARQTPRNREALFRTAGRVVRLMINCGRFSDAIELSRRMRDHAEKHGQEQWEAAFNNTLGIAYRNLPTGDRAKNIQQAIACHQAVLRVHTEDGFPQEWAVTQTNLGNAYWALPTGDRGENLQQAIACYQAALRARTENAFPQDWAMTQNNLGNAYADLPTGDRGANLQQAIACYQAALRVQTEDAFPTDWAMTQNNLGIAYRNLPTGDRAKNIQQAIACYQAALRVYTEDAFPTDWAITQNNLGNTYSQLPAGDRAENVQQAIACYQAALRVRTEDAFPVQWATTQNNLGIAYANLPTGDRGANLQQAIASYQAALRVRTEDAFPVQWAMTMHNLGLLYLAPDLPGEPAENRQRAIVSFEAALRVFTEENFPRDHARAVAALQRARAMDEP